MSERLGDEVSQRKIEFVARKWTIPEDEAERMLRARRAREAQR